MPLKIILENYSLWIEYIFSIDVLTPSFWNFQLFPIITIIENTHTHTHTHIYIYNYLLDHSKEYNLFAFLP